MNEQRREETSAKKTQKMLTAIVITAASESLKIPVDIQYTGQSFFLSFFERKKEWNYITKKQEDVASSNYAPRRIQHNTHRQSRLKVTGSSAITVRGQGRSPSSLAGNQPGSVQWCAK